MAPANTAEAQADQEAADWFAKLNQRAISTPALEAFHAWRKEPLNDAAYGRIEHLWDLGERLAAHPSTQRDVAQALARGEQARIRRTWWRQWLAPGLGLALAGALAVYLTGFGQGQTYRTPVGEQRLVALADGSRVRLDTDTELKVRLGAAQREVRLVHGRAFFDVAHDAARPFIVEADGARVRAVGTRFDVRLTGAEPQVTLVEGVVEVSRSQAGQVRRWRLTPGQALVPGSAKPLPTPVDLATATSWTAGQLVFHATPLSDAVAEVNRYSRTKIVLENSALAAQPVSGKFDVGDTQAFVAAVCDLFELSAGPADGGEIRLTRKT